MYIRMYVHTYVCTYVRMYVHTYPRSAIAQEAPIQENGFRESPTKRQARGGGSVINCYQLCTAPNSAPGGHGGAQNATGWAR